jgi:hypothetical protein
MYKSIKLIHEENRKLHPDLEVIRISWSIKALKKVKKLSLLRLEVLTPEKANEILDRRLLVDYIGKDTELFEPGCHIVQCHQCQEYGHTSHICKKVQKCANCAGNYRTNLCPGERDSAYTNCDKKGHRAWQQVARYTKI